jgi:hypothetical protein
MNNSQLSAASEATLTNKENFTGSTEIQKNFFD